MVKGLLFHCGFGITGRDETALKTKTVGDEDITVRSTAMDFAKEFIEDQVAATIEAEFIIFDRCVNDEQVALVLQWWGKPIYTIRVGGPTKSFLVNETVPTLEEWKTDGLYSWLTRKVG